MKSLLTICVFFCALPLSIAQILDIEGKARITVMDEMNNADSIVVVLPDGTLARRNASTLDSGWILLNDSVYTLKHVSIGKLGTENLFEIFIDSLLYPEINDQSSIAAGSPLLINNSTKGAQSFIIDTTGNLTRIEVLARKSGASISNLQIEIRTGNDPAAGTIVATESFDVQSAQDSIYSIAFTSPPPVTKDESFVMIVMKNSGGDAEWQRSSSNVYDGGSAFVYASGWAPPLLTQDHWFKSYIEIDPLPTKVPAFSVDSSGLVTAHNRITELDDPINDQDAATKKYVDNNLANQNLSDVLMQGNDAGGSKITNLMDPTLAQDAATKNYVDQMSEMMLDAGLNGIVKDIDGNVYKTIKIGTQVWMAENLRTTKYNDGTAIPNVTDNTAWSNLTTPAYCYYDNDSTLNAEIFGALYNFFTVADTNSLNVCPFGWDVPSDADWTVLSEYLTDNGYGYEGSGSDIAKSMGAKWRWVTVTSPPGAIANDLGTNNSSGFSALPSAQRRGNTGFFTLIGLTVDWWSSTDIDSNYAWLRFISNENDSLMRENPVGSPHNNKKSGFSVRCLKD